MSKPTFTKLGLKKKDEIEKIQINGLDVEVKQYLPIEKKIDIVTNVLQNSIDENHFINPIKVEVYFSLEVVYNYTNISFTDKQKEDPTKIYDLLESSGVFEQVISMIPDNEYGRLLNWTEEVIDAFGKHRDSVMGILEQVSTDYSNLNLDADTIKQNLGNPEELGLLKDVITKLG